jgi:hypothetical protein
VRVCAYEAEPVFARVEIFVDVKNNVHRYNTKMNRHSRIFDLGNGKWSWSRGQRRCRDINSIIKLQKIMLLRWPKLILTLRLKYWLMPLSPVDQGLILLASMLITPFSLNWIHLQGYNTFSLFASRNRSYNIECLLSVLKAYALINRTNHGKVEDNWSQ